MARDLADRELLSLGDFARVEPPAWLDELVQRRMGARLEQRRSELAEPATAGSAPAPAAKAGSGGLGRAEAWAYAFGFLAYGAQVADGLARLMWRAMTG
jgi:hypothetical protein